MHLEPPFPCLDEVRAPIAPDLSSVDPNLFRSDAVWLKQSR